MTEPANDPSEALRERAFLLAGCPEDILEALAARVDREGWQMLMAALAGERPTAFELAEHARRRAALWTRRAETNPELGEQAAEAREDWRRAEGRHTTAVVVNAALSEYER
jgi:hypothetical protein